MFKVFGVKVCSKETTERSTGVGDNYIKMDLKQVG